MFAGKAMRLATTLVGAFVLLWIVAVILVALFACRPVGWRWDMDTPLACIYFNRFFTGISIPNILADVIILCLLLPQLWALKLPSRTKMIMCGISLTGGLLVGSLHIPSGWIHWEEENV